MDKNSRFKTDKARIFELHEKGLEIDIIATRMGCSKKTVRCVVFPEHEERRKESWQNSRKKKKEMAPSSNGRALA